MRLMRALLCPVLAALTLPLASIASAELPPPVARAFADQHIPLAAVSAYVQELGTAQPCFAPAQAADQPGLDDETGDDVRRTRAAPPEYRWKTEAFADGKIAGGVLQGNLVLKGYGDPKITIEQFQELIARLRATGLSAIRGDLIVDRSYLRRSLRPRRVRRGAAASLQRRARCLAGQLQERAFRVRAECRRQCGRGPHRAGMINVAVHGTPRLVEGLCGDWKAGLVAAFDARDEAPR